MRESSLEAEEPQETFAVTDDINQGVKPQGVSVMGWSPLVMLLIPESPKMPNLP